MVRGGWVIAHAADGRSPAMSKQRGVDGGLARGKGSVAAAGVAEQRMLSPPLSLNVAGTWTRRPPGAFRPVVSRWGRRVALALHAGVRGAPPASGVRAPRRVLHSDLRGAHVSGSAVREARAAAREGHRRLRPAARISAAEPRP